MKQHVKIIARRVIETLGDRISKRLADSATFSDEIAYRVALETMGKSWVAGDKPNKTFSGISEGFWFWLNTQGYRKSQSLQNILPGMPDQNVQLMFTGNHGDAILRLGFSAYILFKKLYETNVRPIGACNSVLDFGCGWGRIIRFFLKDVDPSKLYGCDPVEEMINLCRMQNRWCNFIKIDTSPPTPFQDSGFDLIYGYSVFSHLSEEKHRTLLHELSRILKPGGLLIMTTRSREFVQLCADLRKGPDLNAMHPGPRSSASAFLNTSKSLADYDNGKYCFSPLEHDWSYWGEAAISKAYVLSHWTSQLTFIDYIDDPRQCEQNVIVMRKPALSD